MTIQEEFYSRIDNDNGYDNQKLGDDLIKIAEKHHKEQLSLCSVSQQRELLSVFDGFYEWHKKKGYVSVKRDDFEEYLKTLNCA